MCFDLLYNLYLKHFFILRIIERDVVINMYRSLCEVPFLHHILIK